MNADPTTPAPNPYAAACASSELLLSPEEERAAYTRQLYARLAAERAHALRSGKLVKLFSALPWPDLYADLPPREARAPQLFDLMYDPALLYACRNDQGPPLAYALAHIRRGPYYYDVAPGLHALRMHQQALMREQERQVGPALLVPTVLVWLEAHESEAAARARIEQVRALPPRWQRWLIERQNLEWRHLFDYVDLHDEILMQLQGHYCVPETLQPPRSV